MVLSEGQTVFAQLSSLSREAGEIYATDLSQAAAREKRPRTELDNIWAANDKLTAQVEGMTAKVCKAATKAEEIATWACAMDEKFVASQELVLKLETELALARSGKEEVVNDLAGSRRAAKEDC